METSVAALAGALPNGWRGALVSAIPWYCHAVVFGATCILIGIIWDISWHSTIGRDTFWTPAHLAIYLGGTLGGLCCGWLVLKTTFHGSSEERARAVRVWGFRGPLGAWVSIWGAIAMLTSAPFDNWWHDAYGLDVQILSPPHSVLAAGMYAVVAGALLLVLSLQNRSAHSAEERRPSGSGLFVYGGGILLAMASIMVTEYSMPNQQHTSIYYKVSCGMYPLILVALARASTLRWPATTITAIYMGLMMAMIWILPLFPATPQLAPIYNRVTHMVPAAFPHLLIVPAIAIDLLLQWIGRGRGWKRDLLLVFLIALTFVALFIPVQWFFSKYILSPAADNWIFAGNRYWSYGASPGEWRTRFWNLENDPLTLKGTGMAFFLALASSGIALWRGNWLAHVKR